MYVSFNDRDFLGAHETIIGGAYVVLIWASVDLTSK